MSFLQKVDDDESRKDREIEAKNTRGPGYLGDAGSLTAIPNHKRCIEGYMARQSQNEHSSEVY